MRLKDTLLKRISQSLLKKIFRTQLAEPYQIAHTVQKHHDNHFHQVHSQNETSPSTQVKCTSPGIHVLTRCQSMNQTDTQLQKQSFREHQTCRSGNLPLPSHVALMDICINGIDRLTGPLTVYQVSRCLPSLPIERDVAVCVDGR